MLLTLLAGAVLGMGGYFMYKSGAIKTVGTVVSDRIHRFRKLNNFVRGRYNNRCRALCISVELVCKALYLTLIQWLNNSVTQIDKNKYTVSYVVNGRKYTMIVSPPRGPCPILLAMDENGDDISDRVIPCIGPKHDCVLTPEFFGMEQLTLETSFGETMVVGRNEEIKVDV